MNSNDIRKLRQALDMSQTEFASLMATSQATISRLENDTDQPGPELAERLSLLADSWEHALEISRMNAIAIYRARRRGSPTGASFA